MAGSYEKINYSLRPAKFIERKMLCETFRRLQEFALIESYRYIGFGSTYFSDFILLHKSLGLTNMISIEKDIENEERFIFNVPYNCINLEFGHSTEVLSRLPWDLKSIIWLDYDGQLNLDMLADIKHIFGNFISGSVFVISFNATLKYGERLENIKENLGEKVPYDLTEEELNRNTAKVLRNIINSEIMETLSQRNGIRPTGNKYKYKQLYNFQYKDGAKMMTLGGIFYDEGEIGKVDKCRFSDSPFVKEGEESYSIEVPNLTFKEIRHLDTQLPCADLEELNTPGAPKDQIKKYAQYYRYFPRFAETEF